MANVRIRFVARHRRHLAFDFADANVAVLAEQAEIGAVITTDRDFEIYRDSFFCGIRARAIYDLSSRDTMISTPAVRNSDRARSDCAVETLRPFVASSTR